MDIAQLESFYQVVRHGSFSAAADALDVSKGALSRHVTALEASLCAQLLQRTTRRLVLTEAGQSLYAQAGQIFALKLHAEQSVRALTEEESGVLRFTAPVSTGERLVADLVARFGQLCPQVRLELDLSNAPQDLSLGQSDLALRAMERLPEDLVARHIGRLKDLVVASPALLARVGAPQTPFELAARPCLLQGSNPAWDEWCLLRQGEEARVTVQGTVRVNHYGSALRLAEAGVGLAKAPLLLVEEALAAGRLVQVLPEWHGALHPLYLLHAPQRPLPAKLRRFKELILAWFEDHPHYWVP